MLVTVVTPTKNSSALIPTHYKEVTAEFDRQDWDYQIIYVDDGSSDSSVKIISDLNRSDSRVRGIFLSESYGQQTAISVGFMESTGDVNITLDVDLEIPARIIPPLTHKVLSGNHYVPVHRVKRVPRGFVRDTGSRFFNLYMRSRTGLAIRDFGCGAAGHSKSLMESMKNSAIPYIGLKHLAGQLAPKIVNFPVEEVAIGEVRSSYNFTLLMRAFMKEHKIKTGLILPPASQIKTTERESDNDS